MKLSQITCVSHCHLCRGDEGMDRAVSLYMVPLLMLAKLNQCLAFPSSALLFISYLRKGTACTVVCLSFYNGS